MSTDKHNHMDTMGAGDTSINVNQLWQTVLGELERQVSRSAFDNWLRQTRLADVVDDVAYIQAPNAFSASTLQGRYATRVERELSDVVGRRITVEFTVDHEMTPSPGRSHPAPAIAKQSHAPKPQRKAPVRPAAPPATGGLGNRQLALETSAHGLVPRLTFETYVVGSSNRLAHAAAQAIAEHPGRQYNPFFVHGGVGLGKTHLLHAVGHRALEINPDLRIVYVTSETFTNDVINAIRSQRMEEFRNRYRAVDILMVDDIQFIAGKESTQEEFFHTFNALYQNDKQVIVSSDKPPRAIAQLEERMRSRFAGGLVADVQSPDFEMRTAILRTKADELGVNLPPDVVEYISHRDQTNIRELEGALNKILMLAHINNRPLNLSLAMEALAESGAGSRRQQATAADVIDAVCERYGVAEKDIQGRQRTKAIVLPRQVAMYLLREETQISLEEIGRAIGGRDHTTVLHGIKKIEAALEKDIHLRTTVMDIRESLMTNDQ